MAFRSDIKISWHLSPRIITILAPSTSVSIQDLHDTLRKLEQLPENMVFESLISSAGKESLGGGVNVGITSTLNNSQLEFESRSNPTDSGSATSLDTSGTILIDSTANFITSGIERGALIYNLDDGYGSVGSIISVDSETQLTHTQLNGGNNNTWQSGNNYAIFNIVACDVSGGNLVATDNLGNDINPIFPSFGTQATRTSSSSATIQDLDAIQFSSYNGGVTINTLSSFNGTAFPVGTLQQPVNNISDALSIANENGLESFFLLSDITLDQGNFSNKIFVGKSTRGNILLDVKESADVSGCNFKSLTISGDLNNQIEISNCIIQDITFSGDLIEESILSGTIMLTGSNNILIKECVDTEPSDLVPIIDMNSYSGEMAMRNYIGGIAIINKNDIETLAIDLDTGKVILDSTVTNGKVRVRGIGKVEDNSTGSAVLNAGSLINTSSIASAVWDEPASNHIIKGTFGEKISKKMLTIAKFLGLK